jgi:fatty-acid peroxygenase
MVGVAGGPVKSSPRSRAVVRATRFASGMTIPTLGVPDSTAGFLRDGYLFGGRRFARVGSDAFRTRIAGRPVIVARGLDAARFFAEGGRFTRVGALPPSALRLLQDVGSVQTLDGDAHRRRKELFLEVAAEPGPRALLVGAFREAWIEQVGSRRPGPVALQEFAARTLTAAVLSWAGIDADDDAIDARTREFDAMVRQAGTVGPPNWAARMLRHRTERWATELIERQRREAFAPAGSPLATVAAFEEEGAPLLSDVAAVELINLLRPTVAVGRFIVFTALALHRQRAWALRFREGDDAHVRAFADEVRRYFPFFPVVGGRARTELMWRGERLEEGSLVLLDLYGTDHDPGLWPDPDRFDPRRFDAVPPRDALIAQGAGDLAEDHRCPGEPATVDLLGEAVRLLTRGPRWSVVPDQDLRISPRRFPTGPADGLRVTFAATG